MCGIAGEMSFKGKPSIHIIASMNEQMQNRGPDGEGIIQFDNLCMGQRRLKIFDLSERAQQPMHDPALGLSIVFNGAIYNHRELRTELEKEGYSFFSDGDTEVLLKAYHCWGMDMLPKLAGMFAFAISERDSGRLVLCRDRMGIKPLYYSVNDEHFRFSSTLSALLCCPNIDKTINPVALHYYLTLHAIPEPLTMLCGVLKLSPGTVIIVDKDGSLRSQRYWSYPISHVDFHRTENDWVDELETVLTRAIKRRLNADVSTGILLSGGLDSSLLVALSAKAADRNLETFSVGFESSATECGDEFYYSDMVAGTYGTTHHKLLISNDNLYKTLEECVASMSEPMTSHDNIGFYSLSKEVAKHVKVVQSGQGADEILAGYHWFQNSNNCQRELPAGHMLADRIADRSYIEYLEALQPEYRVKNYSCEYLEKLCHKTASPALFDHISYYESTMALTNGPLARVDNMTMAWGLEARVPFLDHEVVELVSTIPAKLKLKNGGKHILKQLARKHLPDQITNRDKGYFPVPALQKIDHKMLSWLKEILSPQAVAKRGLFHGRYVEKLFAEPNKHVTPTGGNKLWQLGVLELWLQTNQIA